MTLSELVTSISQKLDENAAYYPPEEVVTSGINPAMRLLAMTRAPLIREVLATVSAESILVDLRQAAPRLWKLRRVVHGSNAGGVPIVPVVRHRRLDPTKLESLAWQRDWFLRRGDPEKYWIFGQHWLGVYKRPTTEVTLTLTFNALPLAFTVNQILAQPQPEPELQAVYHALIPDVAYALLIVKEGAVEGERAEQVLQQVFGQELTRGLRRALREQRQPVT